LIGFFAFLLLHIEVKGSTRTGGMYPCCEGKLPMLGS
jgi:hypothetical protein